MKIAVFSTKPYDQNFLEKAFEGGGHDLTFLKPRLDLHTAALAKGQNAICAFVNDDLGKSVLTQLSTYGVKFIALRCAGHNNVDLPIAKKLGISVCNVPAYSPYAVAEHSLALALALNRKIPRAYNRSREGNFSLSGLVGFDLNGKTIGIIGTGRIGEVAAKIFLGFGCNVLAHDPKTSRACLMMGVEYVSMDQILAGSDIITLYCPLTPETKHIINSEAISRMKQGIMIINTSRGGLIDTKAVIDGLKSRKIGYLGIDVYEEEAELFFEDQSGRVIQDDIFARLTTFPNVIITGHQGFLTKEALENIAQTTSDSINDYANQRPCEHAI